MTEDRTAALARRLALASLSRRRLLHRAAGAGLAAPVVAAGFGRAAGAAPSATSRTSRRFQTDTTTLVIADNVSGGLWLTLDPSHFINGPHQGGTYDELFPYVRHVHLRDTGKAPGKFQVRVGQGEIEYGRIISQLQRCRYERLLSVALHDVAEAPFAMETEVRKLKYLLESLA